MDPTNNSGCKQAGFPPGSYSILAVINHGVGKVLTGRYHGLPLCGPRGGPQMVQCSCVGQGIGPVIGPRMYPVNIGMSCEATKGPGIE